MWQIKNEREHSCSLTDAKYTSKDPIQKMKREVFNEDFDEDSSDSRQEGKKIRRSAEDQIVVKKANERRFIEIIFVISRAVVDKYKDDTKVGFRGDGAREQNLDLGLLIGRSLENQIKLLHQYEKVFNTMQLHYRSADIELLLLDIMIWRDDELSLVDNDSGENLNKFTDWVKDQKSDQKSERFNRKGLALVDFSKGMFKIG